VASNCPRVFMLSEMQADLVNRMAHWSGAKAPVMLLDLERIAVL
jgi:hypothetical protein